MNTQLMKKSLASALVATLILSLSGCVYVREKKPDEVTTTRQTTTVGVPGTTTVERTTVY